MGFTVGATINKRIILDPPPPVKACHILNEQFQRWLSPVNNNKDAFIIDSY